MLRSAMKTAKGSTAVTRKKSLRAMTDAEMTELRAAKQLLENPGLAAKMSSALGSPIEKSVAMLPKRVQQGDRKSVV